MNVKIVSGKPYTLGISKELVGKITGAKLKPKKSEF
jgi:hypothetical protein